MSNATARLPLDQLKTIAFLSDTTGILGRPETILEIRKEPTLLEVVKKPMIQNISKILKTTEGLAGQQFLDVSANIIKYKDTNKTFPQSGKQDSFGTY